MINFITLMEKLKPYSENLMKKIYFNPFFSEESKRNKLYLSEKIVSTIKNWFIFIYHLLKLLLH